jgi:hypothetical protein
MVKEMRWDLRRQDGMARVPVFPKRPKPRVDGCWSHLPRQPVRVLTPEEVKAWEAANPPPPPVRVGRRQASRWGGGRG